MMPERAADADAFTRLYELGLRYLKEGKLEPILTEIVDTAISFAVADFGSIQVLDLKTGRLKLAAQRGFDANWVRFWNNVAEGQGVCGTALRSGERVIVEDVETSPIFAGSPALKVQLAAGVRAVQSTPLHAWSGRVIGMFSTHYRKRHRPDDKTLRALDLLAHQAAAIIERSQNDDKEREMQRRIDLSRSLLEFNHIVSHDLREPIRTASVLLDLYLRHKPDKSLAEAASKAIKRTLNLLNAVIEYSKVAEGQAATLSADTGQLLHEARRNLQALVERNRETAS